MESDTNTKSVKREHGDAGPGSPDARFEGSEAMAVRQVRRSVRRDRLAAVGFPALSGVLIVLAWFAAIRLFDVPPYILPGPERVFSVLYENVVSGRLWEHTSATLSAVGMGYTAAVVVGILCGILMATWKTVYRLIYPPIVATQGLPKSALAPLFLIWFGLGLTSKIVIAMMIAFFPIVIAMFHGLRSVPPDLLRMGRSLGLSRRELFIKIQFPSALPELFSGLKVGIALSIVGAIVAEFVAANRGLGYLIIIATSQLNTALVFGTLFVLAVMGVVLYTVVDAIERLVIPWHTASGRGSHDIVTT